MKNYYLLASFFMLATTLSAMAEGRNLDAAGADTRTLYTCIVGGDWSHVAWHYVVINDDLDSNGEYSVRIGSFAGDDRQHMKAVDAFTAKVKEGRRDVGKHFQVVGHEMDMQIYSGTRQDSGYSHPLPKYVADFYGSGVKKYTDESPPYDCFRGRTINDLDSAGVTITGTY